jgi:acetyl-CoA carboxylase carboxyl transferase subunit beta
MSWIDKILPPRINRNGADAAAGKRVPEGLWVKCPACESVLYKEDLKATLNVCPNCSHHMRIGARARIDALLDAEGRVEIGQNTRPGDPLKFRDTRKYPERVAEAVKLTGESEAMVVMSGSVHSVPVVLACFEFAFMGGSMGSVVGERFCRGVQAASHVPFVRSPADRQTRSAP